MDETKKGVTINQDAWARDFAHAMAAFDKLGRTQVADVRGDAAAEADAAATAKPAADAAKPAAAAATAATEKPAQPAAETPLADDGTEDFVSISLEDIFGAEAVSAAGLDDKKRRTAKLGPARGADADHTQVVAPVRGKKSADAEAADADRTQVVTPLRLGEADEASVLASDRTTVMAAKPEAKADDIGDLSVLAAAAIASEKKTAKAERKVRAQKAKEEARQQKNNGKNKKKKRFRFLRVIGVLFLILIALALIAGGVGAYYLYGIIKDTPDINPNNIYELLSENSILLDADGNTVENIYQGDSLRTNIEYRDLPKNLINAFVSIEDKTFFEHKGFNVVRIFGAIWQWVKGDSDRIGGTSTITQQLARNLYLAEIKGERDMTRKIQEAYYTLIIERSLSKEQILEAYLNTIYLGYNCNGVAAAAQAYFSKEVKDLSLLECAQLAALPQSPNAYAPLKRVKNASISDPAKFDILTRDDEYTVYYNDAAKSRINLVLYMMHEQGKISDAAYQAAKADDIRNYMKPGTSAISTARTSYFADYVVDQVLSDLMAEYNYTREEARQMLYNSGLYIYSTIHPDIQAIMEEAYEDPENFPAVGKYPTDKTGNILDNNDKILLYDASKYFTEDGDFVLQPDEFEWQKNGDLKVFAGKRINIYRTIVGGETEYSVEFKNLFEIDEEVFYSRSGGVWNIASKYKDRDADGNLILAKSYFTDKPDAFKKQSDGTLLLSKEYFTMRQRVRQPQSAMAIVDFTNGQIVGMVGGRDIEGKLLYNRALSPRQPGSSVKPIAIYSVALQTGMEEGGTFTAATPVDDMPIFYHNSLWPKNAYQGYRGITTLRRAVENSINACSVQFFMQLDMNRSVEFLQNAGITSLVTSGDVNDMNASALALGGMTRGISPLEMASAYGTFPNYGVHVESVCYTKVTNKKGDVILEKVPESKRVMDEPVASLMIDILGGVVNNGTGRRAKLETQPAAGKTGTTSERYDIWFCGFTPQYSAAVWIGNDMNIDVGTDSGFAASLWAKVMDQVGAMHEREEFEMRGEFVKVAVDRFSGKLPGEFTELDPREGTIITETFIKGTEPTQQHGDVDDAHRKVSICAESGYLATPYCLNIVNKLCVVRPGGYSWEKLLAGYMEIAQNDRSSNVKQFNLASMPDSDYDMPEFYCPLHRPPEETEETLERYPVSPLQEQSSFDPQAAYEAGLIDEPEIVEPVVDPTQPVDPSDITTIPVLPDDEAGWYDPTKPKPNTDPGTGNGVLW